MAKQKSSENPICEKILKAAVKLLGDSGIKKLAQPQIAKKAGVPQGHMTYYFPTRSDLLMAVAERSFQVVAEAFLKKAAQLSAVTPEDSLRLVEPLIQDKSRTRMLVGLLVESDENPKLRKKLQENLRLARELIGTVIEKDPQSPEVTLMNATLLGLGIQYHLDDPALEGAGLGRALQLLAKKMGRRKMEKVIDPSVLIGTWSWVAVFGLFAGYVFLRAVILQGGLYVWITKAACAARHQVYRLPFSKGQFKSEAVAGLLVVFIDASFIATLVKLKPPLEAGASVALTFLINFVWFEIWFYVSHRMFHHPSLYFLHKQHHVAKVTSPMTALSFSVLERLILLTGGLGFIFLVSFFIPISAFGTGLYFFINYLLNLFGHSNIEIIPPAWLKSPLGRVLNAPTYHALHHARYKGHYGLFTPYLDRWFGSRFADYEEVQKRAHDGQGLTSLGQRLSPQKY